MHVLLTCLLATSVAVIFWSYCGYAIYLWVASSFTTQKSVTKEKDYQPGVSLVISAFNEASVIKEKLDNASNLDYPQELLEVLVISDASDDGTDEIVNSYEQRPIELRTQTQRQGKTAGLSAHVPTVKHEIIVFTDANAIFDEQAISKLVRHFTETSVGYVVGQQKYFSAATGEAGDSESLYWKYETWIKQRESRFNSVVGGDGAIYATRKSLFQPLRYDDINDFVNPLQIIAKGYRGLYEPEAICFEHAAGSFKGEFKRKIRIVNRSIRATFRVPEVLNPLRTGIFAFHLLSHKILRWLTAFFMLMAFVSNLLLCLTIDTHFPRIMLAFQLFFYICAALGTYKSARNYRIISIPYYFCLANFAAGIGVTTYLMGRKYVSWSPDRTAVKASQPTDNQLARVTHDEPSSIQ